MTKYRIDYDPEFEDDIKKFKKTGDKLAENKIKTLLKELAEHPKTGTGKPEQLKGYNGKRWSRRITQRHRLCYEIHDDIILVLVFAAYGHYEDD